MSAKIDRGVTVGSKYGAMLLVGWFGASAYHTTLAHQKKAEALTTLQTQVIPKQARVIQKLASVAGCQTKRAQVATREAVKANAAGIDVDIAAIPNCPPPKAALVEKSH